MTSSSRVVSPAAAMWRSSLSRPRARQLCAILGAILLTGCGATGGDDRPDAAATIVLAGPPTPGDAGMASAVARGYDEAEGVHLRLRPGPATPRTLTSGARRFAGPGLNELAGHPDVVAVMALVQEPLLAFTTPRHQLDAAWARRLARVLGRPVGRWD